jgi:hypothetical protein
MLSPARCSLKPPATNPSIVVYVTVLQPVGDLTLNSGLNTLVWRLHLAGRMQA